MNVAMRSGVRLSKTFVVLDARNRPGKPLLFLLLGNRQRGCFAPSESVIRVRIDAEAFWNGQNCPAVLSQPPGLSCLRTAASVDFDSGTQRTTPLGCLYGTGFLNR